MDSTTEIIAQLKEQLKVLVERESEIRKVELAIYYGALGEGRGSMCIRITLPCDEKSSEEC